MPPVVSLPSHHISKAKDRACPFAEVWPPRAHFFLPLLFLVFLLAGCAGVNRNSAAGDPPGEKVVLRPLGAVKHYEERHPAHLSGMEGQVLALLHEIAARIGKPSILADVGTQGAALEICRGLLPSGPPPASLVEFALRHNGLVDPPPHFVIAGVPPGAERVLLEQLSPRFQTILQQGSFTRVGIGLTEPMRMPGKRRLVVALFQSNVQFLPFKRQLAQGALEILDFTARAGFRNIAMVVTAPTGKISSRPCGRRGGRYRTTLRCEDRGVYQVEIMGDGKFGPEVLANFPIYCAQPPPKMVRYRSPAPLSESRSDLEQDILRRTNRLRQQRGLPVLRPSTALDGAARGHSRDMRKNGFVGHQSPTTGDPADRLDRAGIDYVVVRENVARGYSAAEIMMELMKSPAHRDNILSRDTSVLGVGVALDRRTPPPSSW